MSNRFTDLTFTDAVRAQQEAHGSRATYARAEGGAVTHDVFSDREAAFIATRDSFYMSTVSETGWPYIQHRGGPAGFLKVLGPKQLGFADFRGNRQYLSVGNLQGSDKVSLFLMDYPHKARLKILGHARVTEDPGVLKALALPDYKAKVEHGIVIDLEGFDWNCPAHITPRFTQTDIAHAAAPLHARIRDLEEALTSAGIDLPS